MTLAQPLTTPPLPPATVSLLAQAGITDTIALRDFGVAAAFALLRAEKVGVAESVLWRLHELAQHQPMHSITECEKNTLRQQLANTPPQALFPTAGQMQYWMHIALAQAEQAAKQGEIPVGAVVVRDGQLIAAAANATIASRDISRHAEIAAMSLAGQRLANHRLNGCDLYVTLEPCPMCAGAIIQARIKRLIFAAAEAKTGAAGSVLNLFAHPLNRHTAVLGGIAAGSSRALLQDFFQQQRAHQATSHRHTASGSLCGQ